MTVRAETSAGPRLAPASAELIREGDEVIDDARREVLEQRHQLAPHADAQEPRVDVRGVARERDGVPLDVGEHGAAPGTQERPHELEVVVTAERGSGRQHREAPRSCASHEAQEHGLGAIVGMMRRGNRACAHGACRRGERLEARRPRSRLEVAAARDAEA